MNQKRINASNTAITSLALLAGGISLWEHLRQGSSVDLLLGLFLISMGIWGLAIIHKEVNRFHFNRMPEHASQLPEGTWLVQSMSVDSASNPKDRERPFFFHLATFSGENDGKEPRYAILRLRPEWILGDTYTHLNAGRVPYKMVIKSGTVGFIWYAQK